MEGSEVISLLSHLPHLLPTRSGKFAAWTCPSEMEDPTLFVWLDTPVPDTVTGKKKSLRERTSREGEFHRFSLPVHTPRTGFVASF
jgi:hypothetical protein